MLLFLLTLNCRRPSVFLVFLPGVHFAEQIYLKDGSTLEGINLQQSRTSIQIRTVDGVKTISKDDIKRIDYGKEALSEQQRKEAGRKLEAESIKEAQLSEGGGASERARASGGAEA